MGKSVDIPSIIITNIRSIFNKIDELSMFIKQFPADIIIVTETWLNNSISSGCINIENYSVFRKDRDDVGGGVAIWSRYAALNLNSHTTPGLKSDLLIIRIPSIKVLLFAVYHPYWGTSKWHDIFIADVQRAIDTHLMPGE